ncbi:class I adenylate cyclase [Anaerobiospirillum succiniciproducens]|uniref:class I adenylate cyclase n=1 Tax=Anaerobiospirillum succiniciproducens TaxID=13335 RepID=UPI000A010327|nr:class I adenylate cyclase [Anaerobiospirillum succiniciproducens]
MVYIPKQQILTRFRRYKALNETRLERSLSLMNHDTRFCLAIVPVLLHYNHVNLPGYREGYIPHGIDLFTLNDVQRRYLDDTILPGTPPLQEPKEHAILGLYAMGSTSSLGQTKNSDVDIWVCVKASLSEAGTKALQDKCRFITDYVKAHNVELNLFVTPEDRFTNFQPDSLDEENCGSAQNLFLLDEFYRSSIRLCGRYILWYLISTTEEEQSYQAYADFLTKGISGMPAFKDGRIARDDPYESKVRSALSSQVDLINNADVSTPDERLISSVTPLISVCPILANQTHFLAQSAFDVHPFSKRTRKYNDAAFTDALNGSASHALYGPQGSLDPNTVTFTSNEQKEIGLGCSSDGQTRLENEFSDIDFTARACFDYPSANQMPQAHPHVIRTVPKINFVSLDDSSQRSTIKRKYMSLINNEATSTHSLNKNHIQKGLGKAVSKLASYYQSRIASSTNHHVKDSNDTSDPQRSEIVSGATSQDAAFFDDSSAHHGLPKIKAPQGGLSTVNLFEDRTLQSDKSRGESSDVSLTHMNVLMSVKGTTSSGDLLSSLELNHIEYGPSDSSSDKFISYAKGAFCSIELPSHTGSFVDSQNDMRIELSAQVSISNSGNLDASLDNKEDIDNSASLRHEQWQQSGDNNSYDAFQGRHRVTYDGHEHNTCAVGFSEGEYLGTDFVNSADHSVMDRVLNLKRSEHLLNDLSKQQAQDSHSTATKLAPSTHNAALHVHNIEATATVLPEDNAADAAKDHDGVGSKNTAEHAARDEIISEAHSVNVLTATSDAKAHDNSYAHDNSNANSRDISYAHNNSDAHDNSEAHAGHDESNETNTGHAAKNEIKRYHAAAIGSDEVNNAKVLGFDSISDAVNSSFISRKEYLVKGRSRNVSADDVKENNGSNHNTLEEGTDDNGSNYKPHHSIRGITVTGELLAAPQRDLELNKSSSENDGAHTDLDGSKDPDLNEGKDADQHPHLDQSKHADSDLEEIYEGYELGDDLTEEVEDDAISKLEREAAVLARAKSIRKMRAARRNEAVARAGAMMAKKISGASALNNLFSKLFPNSDAAHGTKDLTLDDASVSYDESLSSNISTQPTYIAAIDTFSQKGTYKQSHGYAVVSATTDYALNDCSERQRYIRQTRDEAVHGYPGFDAAIERDSRYHAVLSMELNKSLSKQGLTSNIQDGAEFSSPSALRRDSIKARLNSDLYNDVTASAQARDYLSNHADQAFAQLHSHKDAINNYDGSSDAYIYGHPSFGQEGEFANGPLSSDIPMGEHKESSNFSPNIGLLTNAQAQQDQNDLGGLSYEYSVADMSEHSSNDGDLDNSLVAQASVLQETGNSLLKEHSLEPSHRASVHSLAKSGSWASIALSKMTKRNILDRGAYSANNLSHKGTIDVSKSVYSHGQESKVQGRASLFKGAAFADRRALNRGKVKPVIKHDNAMDHEGSDNRVSGLERLAAAMGVTPMPFLGVNFQGMQMDDYANSVLADTDGLLDDNGLDLGRKEGTLARLNPSSNQSVASVQMYEAYHGDASMASATPLSIFSSDNAASSTIGNISAQATNATEVRDLFVRSKANDSLLGNLKVSDPAHKAALGSSLRAQRYATRLGGSKAHLNKDHLRGITTSAYSISKKHGIGVHAVDVGANGRGGVFSEGSRMREYVTHDQSSTSWVQSSAKTGGIQTAYPVRSYGAVLSSDESIKAAALDGFREYEAPLNPDEWFDFGSVVFSSPTEYFGSGLWLLYKAIESPLKVVLKILLMEAYSSDYPNTKLLSSELKDYMLSHDGYSIDLDSYYLMYRRVSDYLIASGSDSRLSLMRKCFYLKIFDGVGASNHSHRDDGTLKRELLTKFARRWGWNDSFVSDIEQFSSWKLDEVRGFNREVYTTLLESYLALLRFSIRHGIEYAITSDDAAILSRKLYAAFDRYPGKISVMHTSFSKNLEELHLTFITPSKGSICRRGWHMYTAASDDVALLNLKVAYIGSRLSEVVTWACFNGLMTSRTTAYISGAPTVVTPRMIKQLATDIMRVIGSKRGRVTERNLQSTSKLVACLVVLNLEQDETELYKNQILDTDYGSTLSCGRQRVCLVGSIDLVLINSWGEIRSITLPSGEEGVVELLATLLRILRNTTEVGQEDESVAAMLETIEVCSYAIAYQDLIKYDLESVLRQVFNCLSSNSSSEYTFDVGRNTYVAREQGERGVIINKKSSIASGEYDISVLSRYGMRPEFALQVPPIIDRYATAGIMQYFFIPGVKDSCHWDIYIVNERNEVTIYNDYIGSRATLVNAINRFYTEQSRNLSNITARFNLPQYFVLSKDLKAIHPFTIRSNPD